MVLSDIILSFKLKLDKIDSSAYPDIQPEQILWFLNYIGMPKFVKSRYRDAFESSQKRTDDLRTVVKYATIPVGVDGFFPDSKIYTLPSDYWFSILEQIDVTSNDCNGKPDTFRTSLDTVQHNQINTAVVRDPFNKPDEWNISRVMQGNTIVALSSPGVVIGNVYLAYIMEAAKMSLTPLVQCPLPPHAHMELVDMAVEGALEMIESDRYKTFLNESNKKE